MLPSTTTPVAQTRYVPAGSDSDATVTGDVPYCTNPPAVV
jgi:hypothetical protein